MTFTVCPFCGVVTDTPHDSQQACIEALQSEIERTRQVLTRVGDLSRRERREVEEPDVEESDPERS